MVVLVNPITKAPGSVLICLVFALGLLALGCVFLENGPRSTAPKDSTKQLGTAFPKRSNVSEVAGYVNRKPIAEECSRLSLSDREGCLESFRTARNDDTITPKVRSLDHIYRSVCTGHGERNSSIRKPHWVSGRVADIYANVQHFPFSFKPHVATPVAIFYPLLHSKFLKGNLAIHNVSLLFDSAKSSIGSFNGTRANYHQSEGEQRYRNCYTQRPSINTFLVIFVCSFLLGLLLTFGTIEHFDDHWGFRCTTSIGIGTCGLSLLFWFMAGFVFPWTWGLPPAWIPAKWNPCPQKDYQRIPHGLGHYQAPTAFEPGDGTPNHIFSGPYQNVAEVTEEWASAERERLGRRVLKNYDLWSRYPERIAESIAAERKRCAEIAMAELESWNIDGEYYANVTQACARIAAKVRGGG